MNHWDALGYLISRLYDRNNECVFRVWIGNICFCFTRFFIITRRAHGLLRRASYFYYRRARLHTYPIIHTLSVRKSPSATHKHLYARTHASDAIFSVNNFCPCHFYCRKTRCFIIHQWAPIYAHSLSHSPQRVRVCWFTKSVRQHICFANKSSAPDFNYILVFSPIISFTA